MHSTRYSLIIGVNGYKSAIGSLNFCVSDARQLDAVLKSRRDGFTATESILLTDDQQAFSQFPTRNNIIENITNICESARREDTILIHFSGHGEIGKDGKFYLLPLDANLQIEKSCTPWEEIKEQLEQSKAKDKIFIIDACHSGAGRDVKTSLRTSYKIAEEIERSAGGFVCLTACSGGQRSCELRDLGQGIFSYYLVKGISGAADPLGKGVINIENLYNFVRTRTVDHAKRIGHEQEPHLITKISVPLSTFTICAAPLSSPINQVLVIADDPLIGRALETGISMSTLVRIATWKKSSDLKTILGEIHTKFDYDAVYVDVGSGDEWDFRREFITTVRRIYPIVPFVLVGNRNMFLQKLSNEDRARFRHYFFFDVGIPLSQTSTWIQDTLAQVEWDMRVRYGEKIIA